MCGISYAWQTFTDVIRPPVSVSPPGWFIHEFTSFTDIAPQTPLAVIGSPPHQGAHRLRAQQRPEWRH
jgi:hypothetical protein